MLLEHLTGLTHHNAELNGNAELLARRKNVSMCNGSCQCYKVTCNFGLVGRVVSSIYLMTKKSEVKTELNMVSSCE